MSEGEYQALQSYSRGPWPKVHFYHFAPTPCPICGQEYGGKSIHGGDAGRLEGVVAHLRFKHIMTKKEALAMLEQPA